MTWFQNWRNFGYGQAELERFKPVAMRDNLHTVAGCCKFCIQCLLLLTLVRLLMLGVQAADCWMCAAGCAFWSVLLLLSRRMAQGKHDTCKVRLLPLVFIVGTCLQSLCDDIMINPDSQNVILCMVLMASGILFDLPTTSLCALLGTVVLGAAWIERKLAPALLAQDLLYELVACLVGIAIGRQRIRLRIDLMLAEERRAQEREREMQLQLMFSQIQPHFIYNTLGAIRSLCRTNPPEAVETLDEFAAYLRANLDASAQEKRMLPFREELGNVQHYLALVRRRFGDRIRVALDIQAEDFALPALTLQPLAENAVKHGLSRKDSGGTITISSAEQDGIVTVRVMDDGVGFAPEEAHEEDDHVHLGLENVRMRFETLCDGTMTIDSQIGQGTAVTLKFRKNSRIGEEKALGSVHM